jgi:hypothetical protein
MNLFNLLPVWQLDGSHAFRALSKLERAGIAALMLGMFVITQEGLLLLLLIVAVFRCFEKTAPLKRDLPIFTEFAFLVITLSLLTEIPVNTERKQPMIEGVAITSAAGSRTFAESAESWRPGPGSPMHTWPQPR